jgi:ligand-binding sensor domain-containing protein
MDIGKSFAQLPQYQLGRMNEQEGLRVADIINITIDKDGFMWIASQAHIQRFDGKHRLYFPFEQTLQQVFADQENRKWAISRNGVFLYDQIKRDFIKVPCDSANESSVVGIYNDGQQDVNLLRSNGLYKYNKKGNIFEVAACNSE